MGNTQETDRFEARRARVLEALGSGALLIPAAPEAYRNPNVPYPYRPSSDLYYLTGFREPQAALLLRSGVPGPSFILFTRPRDRDKEIWTGRRAGLNGARHEYGADEAYPVDELWARLPDLLSGIDTLHFGYGVDPAMDRRIADVVTEFQRDKRLGKSGPHSLVNAGEILHEMRLIKDQHEIELLIGAAEITAQGHREAMRATRPGLWEYEIQAILEYQFRSQGASDCAYPTTAASGPNGCFLHYQAGDRLLKAGDLLLLDGGAELEFYASDVTRTFPVTGRFSPDQAPLYDVVLAAQEAAIEKVRPGATLQEAHEAALEILVDGMIQLGLLPGDRTEAVSKESYKRFFMHPSSHWLGLDVHDVGRYKIGEDWRPLEPGMVFTVEPGLYVPEDDLEVDPRFRGMGIRIEDDVLVTPEGNRVLSSGVPKTRDEIERLMAEGRRP